MLHLDVAQGPLELGVDDQNLGTGLSHYVLHLGAAQPEVDRDRHTAVGTGTEQGHEQAGCVL